MDINVYFTLEEKITFLEKKGYTIKKQVETMSWSVYHNDIESEDFGGFAVYKNGKTYGKPCSHNFGSEKWVDDVFQEEMEKRFKELLSA